MFFFRVFKLPFLLIISPTILSSYSDVQWSMKCAFFLTLPAFMSLITSVILIFFFSDMKFNNSPKFLSCFNHELYIICPCIAPSHFVLSVSYLGGQWSLKFLPPFAPFLHDLRDLTYLNISYLSSVSSWLLLFFLKVESQVIENWISLSCQVQLELGGW